MEREISLVFFWKTLKKCWILVTVCALLVGIIVGALVSLTPSTYSSSVDFYTRNNDYNSDYDSQSNLSATEQLINDYVDLIKSEKVLNKVREKLSNCESLFDKPEAEWSKEQKNLAKKLGEYSTSTLRGMISSSSKEKHSTFTIKVTASTPEEAYYVAYAIEVVAPEAVTEIKKTGYLTTEYITSQVAIVIERIGEVDGLDWSVKQDKDYKETVTETAETYIGELILKKENDATTKELNASKKEEEAKKLSGPAKDLAEQEAQQARDAANTARAEVEALKNVNSEDIYSIITSLESDTRTVWELNKEDNFEELVRSYLNEHTSLLKDVSLCFTATNPASETPVKNAPPVVRNAAIGAIVAALAVYLIFFIKGLFEMNISSEDDIKRLVKRPVIGVIPRWETTSKK